LVGHLSSSGIDLSERGLGAEPAPDLGLPALLRRREQVIEFVESVTAVTALFDQLQESIEREGIGTENAPYFLPITTTNDTETGLLEQRPARYRVIYEQTSLA
jgi:hypothetical protein